MRGRLLLAAAAGLLALGARAHGAEIKDACVMLAARTALPEPYVATFKRGPRTLVFVAARHSADPGSDTFRAVETALAAPGLKLVIVEGLPTSRGADVPGFAAEPGGRRTDEARYAAALALARRVPFVGGEPDDEREVERLLAAGTPPEQVLGGLVTRSVASLAGVRTGDVNALIREELAAESRYRRLSPTLAAVEVDFRAWYAAAYGVAPEADPRLRMRGTPCGDGPAPVVIRALTQARNVRLWGLIRTAVAEMETVAVIYGGGHYLALADLLAEAFGPPTVQAYASGGRVQ